MANRPHIYKFEADTAVFDKFRPILKERSHDLENYSMSVPFYIPCFSLTGISFTLNGHKFEVDSDTTALEEFREILGKRNIVYEINEYPLSIPIDPNDGLNISVDCFIIDNARIGPNINQLEDGTYFVNFEKYIGHIERLKKNF